MTVPTALFASFAQQGISSILEAFRGRHISERRLSLIPAYQLDRLIVLKGLARTTRVVKPLN